MYTYTYNRANQLVSVSGAGTTMSYGYNGQGDRVSQTVGITTTAYTLDLAAGLTQVLSDGTDTYLYGVGRIAQYGASGAQYFLGDALGSVRQLADANEEVYERALLAEMRRTVNNWNIRTPWYIATHSCIRDPIRGRYAMSNILLTSTKKY